MVTRPCLVIGASGSLGQAIAHKLISAGRPVALTHSLHSSPVASVPAIEGKSKWYSVDVQDSSSVNALVAAVELDFKSTPDLVYAAGVTKDSPVALQTDAAWQDIIGINLTGAFFCIRALARSLMVCGNGRIVLLGSVGAVKGNIGQIGYAATKGAIESMCRVVAVELGRFGTTCNVVAPGAIESRMIEAIPPAALEKFKKGTPLRRFGKAEEVAWVVNFLLSEESQYITGQTIRIDGGMTAV